MKNLGFLGMDHLSKVTKVYLKSSTNSSILLETPFSDLDVIVRDLRENRIKDTINVKLELTSGMETYSIDELKKTVCSNILQLILKKHPEGTNSIADQKIKNIIKSVGEDRSPEYLQSINNFLEREMKLLELRSDVEAPEYFTQNGSNTPSTSKELISTDYEDSNYAMPQKKLIMEEERALNTYDIATDYSSSYSHLSPTEIESIKISCSNFISNHSYS
uniref:DEK_C domain-containing protein n=1 Tax=Strongyloides papillosus TaxID=174720 RepID=A0A0N5C158_STREA